MHLSLKLFFVFSFLMLAIDSSSGQQLHSRIRSDLTPRIVNGVPTSDFGSVGIVGSRQDGGFCTGTLISANHVLTAAHCAEFIDGESNGTFEIAGQIFFTRRITIHPNYNSRTLRNDVAVLELEEPASGIETSRLFRGEPMVGELLTIVGYGGTGDENGGNTNFGDLHVGTTPIDDVQSTQVFWDFDDPLESNTAAGDSGGPGFLFVNGEYEIATITSGGTESDGRLGDTAVNVRVDAYASWIDGVILSSVLTDEPENEPTSPIETETDLPPLDEPSQEQPESDDTPLDTEDEVGVDDSEADSTGESEPSDCFGNIWRDLLQEILRAIAQWFGWPWEINLETPSTDEVTADEQVEPTPNSRSRKKSTNGRRNRRSRR